MGYIDTETFTVDAILTRRGRELLSTGQGSAAGNFEVTKFAVSDDGVDYRIYDENQSDVTLYGQAIANLPVLEPTPFELKNLRHKLMTLDINITALPTLGLHSITPPWDSSGAYTNNFNFSITPGTQFPGLFLLPYIVDPANPNLSPVASSNRFQDTNLGYTLVVKDASVLSPRGWDINYDGSLSNNTGVFSWDDILTPDYNQTVMGQMNGKNTATVTGEYFSLMPVNTGLTTKQETTISIYSNETGGEMLVSVSVGYNLAPPASPLPPPRNPATTPGSPLPSLLSTLLSGGQSNAPPSTQSPGGGGTRNTTQQQGQQTGGSFGSGQGGSGTPGTGRGTSGNPGTTGGGGQVGYGG